MNNRKIAIILDGLNIGGIERIAINYIKILKTLGYNVTIYNLNKHQNGLYNEIPSEFKIIGLNYKRTEVIDTYDIKFKTNLLWKIVRPFMVIILRVNERKLIKYRENTDYSYAIAFSGHLNDLQFLTKNYINTKFKVAWLHGSLNEYLDLSKVFKKHYYQIHNLVELSNDGDTEVRKEFNIKTLYNPVDILEKRIDQEKIAALNNKYGDFLLMVARFSLQKDHYTVVDAIKILQEKFNLYNKVLFVGDGKTLSKIRKYVKDQGLENTIFFEGSRSDVQNYYSAAKLFVHSSPSEGLPTVLIEAMFLKVPIVATNSLPGVPELLGNNEYGIICPTRNSFLMAQSISKILKDKELYTHYQNTGFERSKDFLFDRISKQFEKYLTEIKR